MKIIYYYILLIFLTSACLEDNPLPSSPVLEFSEYLLSYSTKTAPNFFGDGFLIKVDDVYNNLEQFQVMDIRSSFEFNAGHIPGSINVQPNMLLDYLANNYDSSSGFVLVSKLGNASAYYCALLRLAGYENIYSLNYGLGYWNYVFAEEWLSAQDDPYLARQLTSTNLQSPRKIQPMPNIGQLNNSADPVTIAQSRVELLINDGYESIEKIIQDAYNNGDLPYTLSPNAFVIATGKPTIYEWNLPLLIYEYSGIRQYFFPANSRGLHPPFCYFYNFESGFLPKYLGIQTLPANKNLFIYSYTGQRSSYISAYLNFLGYKTYSIRMGLYGFQPSLFYYFYRPAIDRYGDEVTIQETARTEFAFNKDMIKNYPVETGP